MRRACPKSVASVEGVTSAGCAIEESMNRRDAIQRLAATSALLALPVTAQGRRIVLGQSAAFSGPAAQVGIQMNLGARTYFNGLEDVTRALKAQGLAPVALGTVECNTVNVAPAVRDIASGMPDAVVQISADKSCAAFPAFHHHRDFARVPRCGARDRRRRAAELLQHGGLPGRQGVRRGPEARRAQPVARFVGSKGWSRSRTRASAASASTSARRTMLRRASLICRC